METCYIQRWASDLNSFYSCWMGSRIGHSYLTCLIFIGRMTPNKLLISCVFSEPRLNYVPLECSFQVQRKFKMGILVAQRLKRLPAVQETRVWSLSWEDPLEKEMATHSSILAWRIPWREEPGRLQSMGSQRVGHDWVTSLWYTFDYL